MLRALLCAVVGLAICASSLLAAEAEAKKAKARAHEATVKSVEGDKITLQWTDREGKERENTVDVGSASGFKLHNKEGKTAEASDFKAGDKVTVYLRDRKVVGIREGHGHKEGGTKEGGSKEGGKTGGSKEGGSESK